MTPPAKASLAGWRIVVTRPDHQAQGLCQAIERLGGAVLRFPAIEIAPPKSLALAHASLANIDDYDWLIFISANAVNGALALLPRETLATIQARFAAVGSATAGALLRAGRAPDVYPERGGGGEDLLQLGVFAAPCKQRILIIRGEGGKEWLAQELARRGATVGYAEVYRRVCPKPTPEQIAGVWLAPTPPQIVIVTSRDALENLCNMLTGAAKRRLFATQLVVVSTDMVKKALAAGFARTALLAGPTDESIIETLVNHVDPPAVEDRFS